MTSARVLKTKLLAAAASEIETKQYFAIQNIVNGYFLDRFIQDTVSIYKYTSIPLVFNTRESAEKFLARLITTDTDDDDFDFDFCPESDSNQEKKDLLDYAKTANILDQTLKCNPLAKDPARVIIDLPFDENCTVDNINWDVYKKRFGDSLYEQWGGCALTMFVTEVEIVTLDLPVQTKSSLPLTIAFNTNKLLDFIKSQPEDVVKSLLNSLYYSEN